MLCQSCQTREATVFLSVVLAEVTQHGFCEVCYPVAEAERTKAYNSNPSNPLPTDVENITAEELMAASNRAIRNGADKPVLQHILREVDRFPKTKQRLALEVLELAMRSLDRLDEPQEIKFAMSCWNEIEPQMMPDYIVALEKLIVRCFDQRAQCQNAGPDNPYPFVMPLSMALTTLARVSPHGFATMVRILKDRGGDEKLGTRFKVIASAEQFAARLNSE